MKKVIALVTGGFTGESVISLKSAAVIEKHIDPELFDVYKIIITKELWYYVDDNAIKHIVDRNNFTLNIGGHIIRFDAVFIGLHGSPGEDGKLQGYFDMLDIPYTSCDALTSAITMNKGYTKSIVDGVPNLNVAKSIQLFSNSPENVAVITSSLRLPVFVKPNDGGSSIGMSKVKDFAELEEALTKAFKEGAQVLVEEFVSGREFTVGVFKGKAGIQVLPVTEIVSSKEFFDFEAKYTAGITQEITPGRLSPEELEMVKPVVVEAYRRLNCRGIVRIDFFIENGTGNFFFIEVNTVPGQTEASLIPQQIVAAGRTVRDFYTELLEIAMEK